jgi:hypothetical protein
MKTKQNAHDISRMEQFNFICRKRKKVEMLFADLKRHLGFARYRIQGAARGHRPIPPRRHLAEPEISGERGSSMGLAGSYQAALQGD